MALFSAKNYATIVAPLKKMVTDLQTYMDEQAVKITNLESEKAKIESDISTSHMEITKSLATASKISSLLGEDLDNDGVPDVDQLPDDSISDNNISVE